MMDRKLDEYDILIRNNSAVKLLQRVQTNSAHFMEEVVGTRNTFGISTDEHGVSEKDAENSLVLACSQKSNQLAFAFISPDTVEKNSELVGKYKVCIGRSVPRNGEVGVDPSVGYRAITTVHIFSPGTIFTDTYLLLATFDDLNEAKNFAKYMTLKFPRFLLHETYSSMAISKNNFRFVPYLSYTKEWTDSELYKKYECSNEEISMIESMMRPLEYVLHDDRAGIQENMPSAEIRVIHSGVWVFYIGEDADTLDSKQCGKWMHFFNDRSFAESICKRAVEEGIVAESKHFDADEGVCCFYLNGNNGAAHKRVLKFFLDNGLMRKKKDGSLYNIAFKYDNQTRAGEYGEEFESNIKLDQFVDLKTGKILEQPTFQMEDL